ncbi:MAG: CHRD domain-containing protein, partial [Candidatus Limnocylindria bacterium]
MKTPAVVLALSLTVASVPVVQASDDRFATRLSGFNEVHFSAGPPAALRGAVSTPAKGSFRALINDRKDIIFYELRYEDLTGAVTQAHIHFGQQHTVGGIVVWLCQTAGTPAPDAVAALTPLCPGPNEGTVTGTITPAQVLEAVGQGLAPMEFEELVDAIRTGTTYANVHSATFPP